MSGIADARMLASMRARLDAGPSPLEDLLVVARAAAGPVLGRQEGAIHALLHGLVRDQRLEVVGRGGWGGAIYALPGAAPGPSQGDPVLVPPPVRPALSKAALAVAACVRDPASRGRVVSDVLAHLQALDAEGRLRDFGSVKAARVPLARMDRGGVTIVVPENAWERAVRFARHEGPSMGLTLAILAFVWLFVAEFRVVPSSSMQPVLKPGDRVIVQKLGGKALPDRWDVVVFHRPSDGVVLVKRAVGMPGERLTIEDGDLLVDGRIAVKPDAVREAVREPLVRSTWPVSGVPDGWELAPAGLGHPPGAHFYRPVLFGDDPVYSDEHGRPEVNLPPRPLAHDLYVTARLEGPAIVRLAYAGGPAGAEVLQLERRADGKVIAVVLDREGRALPVGDGSPASGPEGAREVTVAYVDGVARFSFGGVTRTTAVSTKGASASIVVSGAVRSVAIDRDVHYTNTGEYATDPGTPFTVPTDHIFCLGDHSAHSGDSRLRSVGPIPLDRLIGPVRFRVWPLTRIGLVR